jgi:hypothetical protein
MEIPMHFQRWLRGLGRWASLALLALLVCNPAAAQDLRPDCDSCRMVVTSLAKPLPLAGNWLFTRNDTLHNKDAVLDTQTWQLVRAPGPWRHVYPDDKNRSPFVLSSNKPAKWWRSGWIPH